MGPSGINWTCFWVVYSDNCFHSFILFSNDFIYKFELKIFAPSPENPRARNKTWNDEAVR